MTKITLQNSTLKQKFIIVLIFIITFFSYQITFAQSIESQYKTAIDKSDSKKAGELAYQLAQQYHKEENTKEAINYLTEGLKFSAKVKDYKNLGEIYSLLGIIYKTDKNYSLAILNYEKAATAYNLLGDKKNVARSYYLSGILYAELQQYDKAIFNLKETMRIANQANETNLVVQSTEYLSKIYRQKGDKANADLYEEVTEEIRNPAKEIDSLEQQKSKLKIDEILQANDVKVDSLAKEYDNQIAEIETEKRAGKKIFTYIGIGAGMFIILLIAFIIVITKGTKKFKSK